MPAFDEVTAISVTGNTATVASAAIARPKWARGAFVYFNRTSGAPGTAAGIQLELQQALSGGAGSRSYAISASFDTNAVNYYGMLVHPDTGVVAQYSATAPVQVSEVKQTLLPDEFIVRAVRATAQSEDFNVQIQWLRPVKPGA